MNKKFYTNFCAMKIYFAAALIRKIKIRAAHEIMAARAAQLAFLIDQFVAALRTIPPVLARNVFG